MTTETATTEAASAADEKDAKREIHEKIAAMVQEKTGKRIGRTGGKVIFDTVVGMIFDAAVKDESFRFPGGYGSLHVRHLNKGSKPKRLPSGAETTLGEGRKKLRYVEGNEVKANMGTLKAPTPKPAAPATPAPAVEAASPASV